MKRKTFAKIASVLLTLVMLLSLFPAMSFAGDGVTGDADGDGKVTISDATMIQKYIANYKLPADFQIKACDVNGDKSININDVTEIQRFLANLGNPYHIGESVGSDEYELPVIPN